MTSEDKAKIVSTLMGMNLFLTPDSVSVIPEALTFDAFSQDILPKIERQALPASFPIEKLTELFAIIEKKEEKSGPPSIISDLEIISSYSKESTKKTVQDFVAHFKARYESLRKLLQNRIELQNTVSIRRLSGDQREKVAIIGLVITKEETKNKNLMLEIEDPTGMIKAIVRKDKENVMRLAKDIALDEAVGVLGTYTKGVIFVENFVLPEIPTKEFKKAPDEAYAAFTSDLHVGSKMFLPEEFTKFISWLNGEVGSDEQKKIARSVKYLFVVGDLVDGVGIYPGQEGELSIPDITAQYNECAKYLSMIRKDVKIIACPGNHDAGRISEPQPAMDKRYAQALHDIPNLTLVSNPATVKIHASGKFPGFNVLLYHGYGFDYYIANMDSVRLNGGYNRADLLMKMLLQKRHLAPTHASTLYMPDTEEDPLVISTIPDFFVTGHIHKVAVSNYKSASMICCSCWQSKTLFQEKVGHNPEPGRVPVVNLRTREIKVMRFDN